MVALERIHNGRCQLFHIAGVVIGLDLFYQHGVALADIEDKVLLLVREQTADHIISRNIIAGSNANQQHHTLHVRNEMQFRALA